MNRTGHIQGQTNDEDNFRQFEIKCFGDSDKKKYYTIGSFGSAYTAPENTRTLVLDSSNKDYSFCVGVIAKAEIEALNPGERILFSTDEAGENIVSKIVQKNTGAIEINKDISGNANILIKADGTMEFNGNADFLAGFTKLKEGFDQLVTDYNAAIAEVNKITAALTSWAPVAQDGGAALKTAYSGDPSTTITDTAASVDDCKKENLKCE